jgi:hypothetical protein
MNTVEVSSLLLPKDEVETYSFSRQATRAVRGRRGTPPRVGLTLSVSSPTVPPTWIQQSTTRYVPAVCPNFRQDSQDVHRTSTATRMKAEKKIDFEAITSPPGTSQQTMSLITVSPTGICRPQPSYCSATRPRARRWVPHGNSQESELTPRTCFAMDADTRSYTRTRRGAVYSECTTQMCELVAQARARVLVSPQDISRITVEKRNRVCVREVSDLDLLLNKITRGLRH